MYTRHLTFLHVINIKHHGSYKSHDGKIDNSIGRWRNNTNSAQKYYQATQPIFR